MITKKEREEIRALRAAATQGEWETSLLKFCDPYVVYRQDMPPIMVPGNNAPIETMVPNAKFTAKAHEIIPRLLEDVERLEGLLKTILDNDGGDGSKCYDASVLYDARIKARAAIGESDE